MSNIEVVEWCALCNKAASDGKLTVQDPSIDELVDLPACQPCVNKLKMPEQLTLDF